MTDAEAVEVVKAVARCVGIAGNPGFIECRDTDWDEGVNYAKRFIKDALLRYLMTLECELNAATDGKYMPHLSHQFFADGTAPASGDD